MSKITTRPSTFVAALAVGLTMTGHVHAAGWFKDLTGHETPKPIQSIAPNGIQLPRPQQQPSYIAVITPPFIDDQGRIWSGSSRGGSRGHVMRQARIQHNSAGQAYWVDPQGQVSSRRAPQHDQQPTYRTTIDQNTGAVYRAKYIGSQRVSNQHIGTAVLKYATNGRPFYSYGSDQTWANKPWRPTYNQNVAQSQSGGYQGQYNYQNQGSYSQDPGVQLAVGILQIIEAATRQ